MVMPGPHCLNMSTEHDQIHFSSQDSHPSPVILIENSCFQGFWGFQEDFHEFYKPIVEFLEQSYLAISTNNKFQYFLWLAKEFSVDGDTFMRIF